MLTGLSYSLSRVHWPRAFAIALPFPVLAILPLPAKTNAPPMPAKIIPANVISLSGHVFSHGCANVTAKLNGQNIRVSREGDFAVLVKPPRRPLTAFLEFSSPECGGAIEEIRVEPGIARYTVTASLYPTIAKQDRKQKLVANVVKVRRERLPQNVWALNDLISRYAGAAGIERSLVYAMIHTESNFNTHARSRANAVGLMQLIPDQGARAAADYLEDAPRAISVAELRNPATNLRLGTAYLQLLSDRYFSKVQNDEARLALALAAYNWGPGNVQNAIRREQRMPRTLNEVKQMLARRAPPETRRYVDKVTKRMAWYEEIV